MAPHSSTLAWKISWMEEPGRLQSMGSLRVRHDWSDLAAAQQDVLAITQTIPWASQVAQTVKNPLATWETWVRSLGWEVPWRREWLPFPVFLLEDSMDRGAWQATVHRVTKSQIRLND